MNGLWKHLDDLLTAGLLQNSQALLCFPTPADLRATSMLLLTGSSSASFFSGRSSLFNSFSPCFPFSRRCRCLASSIWSSLCFPVQIQIASHIGLSWSAGSAALIHLHCKARSSLRVRAAAAAAAECSLPRLPAHAHLIWVEILC